MHPLPLQLLYPVTRACFPSILAVCFSTVKQRVETAALVGISHITVIFYFLRTRLVHPLVTNECFVNRSLRAQEASELALFFALCWRAAGGLLPWLSSSWRTWIPLAPKGMGNFLFDAIAIKLTVSLPNVPQVWVSKCSKRHFTARRCVTGSYLLPLTGRFV
jgi:hypothetical protein